MANKEIDFRGQKKLYQLGKELLNLFSLAYSTIIYNILGLIFFTYKSIFSVKNFNPPQKIILLAFGGIGNHLMLTPALRCIKTAHPDIDVHVVTTSEACFDILTANSDINSMSVMNIGQMNRFSQYFRAGKAIKSKSPDIVLAATGTNPVAGSLISFFTGAMVRIGEDWKGRGFLYTHRIRVNHSISEVEQNIKLTKFIEAKINVSSPKVYLTSPEIKETNQWLAVLKIAGGTKLLGIHPGCGKTQQWKRWDINNFAEVAKIAAQTNKFKVIFFLGPDESDLIEDLQNFGFNSSVIIKGNCSVRKTAAKINCCDMFLSNDSGLRHIAAALGVKTVGIYGPTSIAKNFISDQTHSVIVNKNVRCSPCHYTKWWLACNDKRPCLNLISVDKVIQTLDNSLEP